VRYDASSTSAFPRDADHQRRPPEAETGCGCYHPSTPPGHPGDTHPSQGPQLPSIPSSFRCQARSAPRITGAMEADTVSPLSKCRRIPNPRSPELLQLTCSSPGRPLSCPLTDTVGRRSAEHPGSRILRWHCSNGSRQRTRPHPERPSGVRHVAKVVACSCQVPAYANCQPGHAILQRRTQPLHHPISGRLLSPNRDACSLARPI
jgi:hypothetical protein